MSNGKTVIELGFPVTMRQASSAASRCRLDYSWIVRITANHLPSEASFTLFDDQERSFCVTGEAIGRCTFTPGFPLTQTSFEVEEYRSLGVNRVARLFTTGNWPAYSETSLCRHRHPRSPRLRIERMLRQTSRLSGLAALTGRSLVRRRSVRIAPSARFDECHEGFGLG
jgi:hypothetical protein